MEISTCSIRPIQAPDIPIIAKIHCTAMPADFCSILGEDFLSTIYYPQLIKNKNHLGLCAVDTKNQIIGFVVFLKSPDFFRHLFFNYFLKLVVLGVQKIWNIRFIAQSIGIFVLIFFRSKKQCEEDYELNYIAIDPACQGIGVGRRLVEQGLKHLADKGSTLCWVKTLSSTPKNVQFYEKNGFQIYDNTFGRVYLRRDLKFF